MSQTKREIEIGNFAVSEFGIDWARNTGISISDTLVNLTTDKPLTEAQIAKCKARGLVMTGGKKMRGKYGKGPKVMTFFKRQY